MSWNIWRLWEPTLHEHLTNIYLYWKFALPTSTLLSASRHFKRFQLNNVFSQLNIFWWTPSPPPPQNFFISADLVVQTTLFRSKNSSPHLGPTRPCLPQPLVVFYEIHADDLDNETLKAYSQVYESSSVFFKIRKVSINKTCTQK